MKSKPAAFMPAFPSDDNWWSGMSLRAWLAGMAASGLTSTIPEDREHWPDGQLREIVVENISASAIQIADEMLRQLGETA